MSRYTHDTPTPEPLPTEPPPLTPDQMYPGWRWTATGEAKLVANATEDEAAAADGYTLKSPPKPEPTPLPTEPPPTYRPRRHDGD
jgi:hypothetical protein